MPRMSDPIGTRGNFAVTRLSSTCPPKMPVRRNRPIAALEPEPSMLMQPDACGCKTAATPDRSSQGRDPAPWSRQI